MTIRRGSFPGVIGVLIAAVLGVSACSAESEVAHASSAAPVESVTREATQPAEDTTSQPSEIPESAEDAFLAWLDASREPDVDAACEALSPELVERMIAELTETGVTQVSNCEEMISVTAELYKAVGDSAEVTVDVQSESSTDATLFVSYANGDCGTVVMHRPGTEWIITEQSQECAA